MTNTAILLDVDGPINPYAAKLTKPLAGYTSHKMRPATWVVTKPLNVRLNPLHGPSLMGIGSELIWATAWEDEANEWIGPHIGLPKLPFIDWLVADYKNLERIHWKTKRIVQWMNENRPGVPFIWIDDEVTHRDTDYLVKNCEAEAWTMQIHPAIGLTEDNFNFLKLWKEQRA